MGGVVGVGDDGVAHPHPGLAQQHRVLGGQEPGQGRVGHGRAVLDPGRIARHAAPVAKGRVAALEGAGPSLK